MVGEESKFNNYHEGVLEYMGPKSNKNDYYIVIFHRMRLNVHRTPICRGVPSFTKK